MQIRANSYLNWQKMSAYSGRMPLACSTVTRKVNTLPSFKWLPISSVNPSIVIFPSSRVDDFRSERNSPRCKTFGLDDFLCFGCCFLLFFFYSLEIFLQTAMYCQHTLKMLFMITKSPKYTETVVLQSYSNKDLTICHMQCISNNFSPSITLFKDIPNPLFTTDWNCPKLSLGSQKQSYIFLAYRAHSFCLSPLGEW